MVLVQVDERSDGERLAYHDSATRSMSSGEKLGEWSERDVHLLERVQVGMGINVDRRVSDGGEDWLETLGFELGMLCKKTKWDLFEADWTGTSLSAFGYAS